MMKSYTAYCMNEDGENMCMTREYNSKKDFMSDLHGNGYKVHFIALTDKYDEECAKYYERLEHKRRISAIRRECEREWREHDKKFAEELTKRLAAEEETTEEPAADQEPEEEASENYIAWCGMIDNDVITDEFETLSEAVDEVESKYNKDEMKAAGIMFCKLLCNSGQWLECLEEKKVDDVFYGPFKKLYDVFTTFSARGLDIYSHKPERWSRNRPPVIALETEEAIYYCDERDKNDAIRFLNRNRTRANKK